MNEPIFSGSSRLRHNTLARIYEVFEDWSASLSFACRRGCAVCCTQGVTISETEGERIVEFLGKNGSRDWKNGLNLETLQPGIPACTTNEFAEACLQQQDIVSGDGFFSGICPLLQDNLCSIYPVRPFSCRCFASTTTCTPGSDAELPSYYLAASTAITQLIEHLDQGRYWGLLTPLLRHLIAPDQEPPPGLLIARPLPGFLLAEEEYPKVISLLEAVFTATVDTISLQDILNGRHDISPR